MPSRAVVWFRRDLRVADHPALLAALAAADQVVPVFVVDRALLDGPTSGPDRRAFLLGALQALARELEALGGRLLVREGDPGRGGPGPGPRGRHAGAVWCSREYTPYARRRDTAVERAPGADGRTLHALPGVFLSDFDEVRQRSTATRSGSTPRSPGPPRPPPGTTRCRHRPGSRSPDGVEGSTLRRVHRLEGAVEIAPRRTRWRRWSGCAGSWSRRVDGYARARNSLATDGTSRLSPLVDAGMRQLTRPGLGRTDPGRPAWSCAPSFLTKRLLVDWREGARVFLQHLVDGDLPANDGGWQSGRRHRHRRRPLLPHLQHRHPGGEVRPRRRLHPPLGPRAGQARPPAIFAPWKASAADLEAAGVRLGADYPHPMVDHATARDRALARFQEASPAADRAMVHNPPNPVDWAGCAP